MPWLITNGKTYLNRNSKGVITATANINHAAKFTDRKQAETFLVNVPKSFKNLGYFCVLTEFRGAKSTTQSADETQEGAEMQAMPKSIRGLTIDDDILNGAAFLDHVKEYQSFVSRAVNQRASLVEALDRVDAELLDIEHAIEFSQCNAPQGYRFYRLMRDTRRRRRQYKDAIRRIDILLEDGRQENVLAPSLVPALKGLENRKYLPRALPELFQEAAV